MAAGYGAFKIWICTADVIPASDRAASARRHIRSFTNPVVMRRRASERSPTCLVDSSLAVVIAGRSQSLIERTTMLLSGDGMPREMASKLIEDFTHSSFRRAIDTMV